MKVIAACSLLLLAFASFTLAGGAKHTLKTATTAAPQEVAAAVAKLLGKESIQFHDPQGNLICELWLRESVPGDATADQVKNGLTYREIPETTVMGVVQFAKAWSDYKKSPIKAGVYTLRLAYQPMDGDHMGTAPHPEFFILTSASKDADPKTIEKKEMIEKSAESMKSSHPGVLLLFPHAKPGATPLVAARPNNHVTINHKTNVTVKGVAAPSPLGIALTLVGHAD